VPSSNSPPASAVKDAELVPLNPTNQHIGIFCDPSYDIRKGDKIKAYVLDDHGNVLDTYTDYAGRPEKHTSHQQFALVNREFA
jgi:hypothetical protein